MTKEVSSEEATSDDRLEVIPQFDDQYDAVEFIGRGGMGSVYKAVNKTSGQILALKVLRPELAADRSAVKRFEQEVTAAMELRHPNLVYVLYASKTKDGIPYMAMNYIKGEGLDEVIRFDRFMPTARALNIFLQIAQALEHAHAKAIIHRDLKPSNILVSKGESGTEHVDIVDFGIAKILAPNIQQTQITQSGELFGSPLYMSPEQCSGKPLDGRSDIYSFGCVMYELLCGKPPFSEDNPFNVMLRQVQNEPPALRTMNPSLVLHKDLEYVVMRCLQKEPQDRYQTITEVLRDLVSIQQHKHVKRRLQTNSRRLRLMVQFAIFLSVSFFLSWSLFSLISYLTSSGHLPGFH
jgi:serine/threonine-protein kinase